MNRRILALLCAAACVAGCKAGVEGVTCESDGDCQSGHCDTATNLCISAGTSAANGSSGSGSTTGSGSTGTSGSSGNTGSSGTTGVFACDGGCAFPEFCNTGIGACRPGYAVRFVTPSDAGLWADGGAQSAKVRVVILAPDSGFGDPSSVTLAVSLGADAGCGGPTIDLQKGLSPGPAASTWTGAWVPGDAGVTGDGPVTLCASAFGGDAGVPVGQDMTLVNVDVTPPSLNPGVSRPADDHADPVTGFHEAYARDGDPLTFDSGAIDTGSGLAGVAFELDYPDGGPVSGVTMTATGTPPSADLNLQQPPVGEHEQFQVQMTAVDNVGNASTDSKTVKITRWKWVASIVGSSTSLLAPSVDSEGTIYITASVPNPLQNVFALYPDGGIKWDGGVQGTPAAGPALTSDESTAFVLDDQDMSILRPRDGALRNAVAVSGPFREFAIGVAPTTNDPSTQGAFLTNVTNSGTLRSLTAIRTDGTASSTGVSSITVANAATGVYTNGTDAFWGTVAVNQTQAAKADLRSATAVTDALGNGSVVGLAETINAGPYGSQDEAFFAGGGGVALVRVDLTGAQAESPPAYSFGNNIQGEILIPSAGSALLAVNGQGIYEATAGGPNFMINSGPSGVNGEAGMLLAGNDLYAESGNTLSAVDFTNGVFGEMLWQLSLGSQITGAPSLLCNLSAGDSILLVPTKGKLAAIVIDEPGLNAASPWPKARRDFRNSANAASSLTACP